MLQASLKVIGGKHDGNLIPLTSHKFLIGRERDCQLRTNSDRISRHHCVFTIDEYSVRLRDLGSTNGTYVNDSRIRGEVMLKPGDSVRVGKLAFEVVIQSDVPAGAVSKSHGSEFVFSPGTDEARVSADETSYELPAQAEAAELVDQDTAIVASAETDVIPTFNPQEQPAQPPQGYPPQHDPYQHPGYYPPGQYQYPPQGYYPQYGQPQFPQHQGGYPQMPGYYPQGQYPYPQPPQDPRQGQKEDGGGELPLRLPDPESTGAKTAPPAAAKAPAAGDESQPPRQMTPSERAAELIKQRMQRR